MSSHHPLRSRVVHQRFVTAAVIANALVLVAAGFTPKDTAAESIFPYVAATNGILLIIGIIVTAVRRNVHRSRVLGILIDLLFAVIVPTVLLMMTGGMVMLMKPDDAGAEKSRMPGTTTAAPSSR